jgi:hypothetical protein
VRSPFPRPSSVDRESGLVVIEVAGQLAVRVGLSLEQFGPVLEGGDRVGAAGEAQRRFVLSGKLDQRVGEFGGVAALLAVHTLPCGDGLLGPIGVVGDRGSGVLRRLRCEQLVRKKPGSTSIVRIPNGATSKASDSIQPSTANLDAAYAVRNNPPSMPAVEEIVTTARTAACA